MSQDGIRRAAGELLADPGQDGLITRGFLRGAGLPAASLGRRPVIGIANTWSELNPCNAGLRELAGHVKAGVRAAGGLPLEFPTISLGEAFVRPSTMYLRNLLAMDTEEMILASPVDGVVLLGGCDKTLPAQLMGAASAGKPALCLPAGPRPLSEWDGRPMTIDGLWPLLDERRAGRLDDDGWHRLEGCLSRGAGTCNVMGTATTMAVVAEVLGMALPGSALAPASSPARAALAEETGRAAVARTRAAVTPAQAITRVSLGNAFRVVCAVGGSTNALLHLQAIAGRLGARLDLAELRRISDGTPLLADVKPTGSRFLHELESAGGVPALMGRLAPLADLDTLAGDGRPWKEAAVTATTGTGCLATLDRPHAPPGTLRLLSGSLAPHGAVLKRSGADPALCRHRGRAVVFDGVDDLRARIDDPDLPVDETSVLVLRYAGPVGGPGMPEVGRLPVPARLLRRGVTDLVRVSDARMSGTATGTVVLHAAPEAAAGGPLALVRDGDWIELDAEESRIDLLVDPAELLRRRESWMPPRSPVRGYERLYREQVTQADEGCDFAFLRAAG
ncbi:dihydroxy-acid dehydratase [Prauserella shujinwangii]|uniref:Dihydroxy-acid dehydratase n=1 Tax=Prauserella shujinwangii TaxID=1453103 RepID=A0A2T0LSH0_9PSEU|nr:dihydroxy-acid dehydratase [Prauserella shujinwangii]PRX46617.1 dihydroxy-acid dehydratase [Prauserella shujinwangii]